MEAIVILGVVVVIIIGALLIFIIRTSTAARRYRNASEMQGSWKDRKAAHYLRKLSLLEVVAIVVVAAVVIFIDFKFGIRLY